MREAEASFASKLRNRLLGRKENGKTIRMIQYKVLFSPQTQSLTEFFCFIYIFRQKKTLWYSVSSVVKKNNLY